MEQLVNDIIKKRKEEHLPAIQRKIDTLKNLLVELKCYDELRSKIVDTNGELRPDYPLYGELLKHPEIAANIFEANSNSVKENIEHYIKELERIAQRFSRSSIAIQVFGEAGSGKSTFIQSVTGLDNNVVLVSSGDHCTGATSFIKNAQKFEAHIVPYTKFEILEIFNSIVERYGKEVTTGKILTKLSSFDEIKKFNVDDYGFMMDNTREAFNVYVEHFDDICRVLNEIETYGETDTNYPDGKFLRLKKPEQVQQYVAQHNGGSDRGEAVVHYYNFLAVKYVRIFKDFNYKKAGNVEIMDSVGFGDARTETAVTKNMCQSVADTCDIVIVLSAPVTMREYGNCSALMDSIHFDEGKERIASECLFMVLNERREGHRITIQGCKDFKKKWLGESGDGTKARKETILQANLSNPSETEQNVIIPILKQVTANLEQIDDALKENIEKQGNDVHEQINAFIQRISTAIIVNQSGSGHTEFDKRFRIIYESELRKELGEIVKKAKESINQPAATLGRSLNVKCNNITQYVEELNSDIDSINPYATSSELLFAYEKLASKLAHLIPSKFKDIDFDLNENIAKRKSLVFNCLYTTGRLNTIFTMKGKDVPEKAEHEKVLEWVAKFNQNITIEEDFPLLHGIINELLTFNVGIEGLLLFRIVKHFDELTNNIPSQDRLKKDGTKTIKVYLQRNLEEAFNKIQPELRAFTVAPNEAIYYALDSFIYNLLYHPDVELECRKLYERYEKMIWRDEMENLQIQTLAMKEWRSMRDRLLEISNNFI